MASGHSSSDAFVEPGNVITRNTLLGGGTTGVVPERMPRMPGFHLVEPGYPGITLINIGTGPSNARTITDYVAVLRPHAWLMLGHCAGRRKRKSSAIMSSPMVMCGRITCLTRNCRCGYRSRH